MPMEAVVRGGRAAFGWRERLERRRFLAAVLIAPAVTFIVVLVGGPLLLAIYLSFTNAIAGSLSGDFIGLDNFTREWSNPVFRTALKNTFLFTFISQAIVLVLAKILANFLVRDFRGKWFLRFLIVLPWAAPISLGVIGWKWIFDSLYSSVNWMGQELHLLGANESPQWTGEPKLTMAAIITAHTWRLLPFATIIIIAGLSSIPREIEDAAAVDGATGWRKMAYVTIPLVLPVMTIALLFGIVFTATDMVIVYLLANNGGPFNSTHMITTWAFTTGILTGSLGDGAAVSLYLFPVLLLVTVLMLWFARRTEVA
jgi:multiple sugar transport system permease protein